MQRDQILISGLEIHTRIGITDAERAEPQRMLACIVLEPARGFSGLEDRIERTADYHEAAQAVKALAAEKPRALVETLAGDIAEMLLARFPLAAVELELRKFILPDAEFVGVRIRRER